MRGPRLVICGGASVDPERAKLESRSELRLDTRGDEPNVHPKLEDVARVLLQNLTPRLIDFLEIASYIYAADAATERDGKWIEGAIEPWERDFSFVVAVRDLEFWSRPEVKNAMRRAVLFISADKIAFEFTQAVNPALGEEYLDLSSEEWSPTTVDRVVMFSGGLDSLAGAVECASKGERLVLVSHRPTSMLSKRQHDLVDALRTLYPATPILHVPVWVNKDKRFGREHTQRTRSFLFTALGTLVAQSLGAKAVTFFENGVVSINLPVADEVINARASRTTHPVALQELTKLVELIVERPLVVENPFVFDTKRDVVARLAGKPADLIGLTCSCAHTGIYHSKTQPHCGACSQCIDRRIALLHAGLAAYDSPTDYKSDVFTGPRKEGPDKSIAVNYARHGWELHRMSEEQLASQFSAEFARAARPHPPVGKSVARFVAMHKRHGDIVFSVLHDQAISAVDVQFSGTLDESSLIALMFGKNHLVPSWKRYADRICEVLAAGLPAACQTTKPNDEPRLQELCDGLLRAADEKLTREYPLMAWGSSKTKADWSKPGTALWVELKYVRARKDVGVVSRAIAQDITTYGDLGRKVVFVVYDPSRHVIDEQEFAEPVASRLGMFLRVIR